MSTKVETPLHSVQPWLKMCLNQDQITQRKHLPEKLESVLESSLLTSLAVYEPDNLL
jgi:hypothetical protein